MGNSPQEKGRHNYGFTTELHTASTTSGGESFTFTGDDDVWVFVNGRLAIDLGGLHPPKSQTLNLDGAAATLGIAPGGTYALDSFHAERHSASSNFRVDTTLAFTNSRHDREGRSPALKTTATPPRVPGTRARRSRGPRRHGAASDPDWDSRRGCGRPALPAGDP